jgi:hypothetical protein
MSQNVEFGAKEINGTNNGAKNTGKGSEQSQC